MKLFVLLSFWCTIGLYGKTKTIIINTDKPIKRNFIFLYYSSFERQEFEIPFEKTGRRQITFKTDSNYFKLYYSKSIEYKFDNLENSISDTIVIDEVKLIPHNYSDSIVSGTLKYNRDSTLRSHKKKTEIRKPENLDLIKPHDIRINKINVKGQRTVEPNEGNVWACTPYKRAYHEAWKGKWITFIYQL